MRVVTLRFWSRTSADFSQFNLDQVSHIGTRSGTEGLPMSIQAISNQSFAVSLGTEEVKVWSQIRMEEGGEAKMVWSVVSALKFRDMKVK